AVPGDARFGPFDRELEHALAAIGPPNELHSVHAVRGEDRLDHRQDAVAIETREAFVGYVHFDLRALVSPSAIRPRVGGSGSEAEKAPHRSPERTPWPFGQKKRTLERGSTRIHPGCRAEG